MSTYKEIFGKYVRSVGSDPSVALGTGEIWYNTSSNTFKSVGLSGSWSSANNTSNTSRTRALAGTQTAAFIAGGYNGANSQTRATEEYDGTNWTSGGDLSPQGNPDGGTFNAAATGTQTAGLFAGGSSQGSTDYYFDKSYEYDGSSWASPATFTTARAAGGLFGLQTAAVLAGGTSPPNPFTATVREYNGSSWTDVTSLPFGRAHSGCGGTQTAGMVFGGQAPSQSPGYNTGAALDYDGTNWTAGGSLPEYKDDGNSSGNGTQTSMLYAKGYNGTATVATAFQYNGTSWAAAGSANTAASSLRSGGGTGTTSLSAGGSPSNSEEFSSATAIVTLSTS